VADQVALTPDLSQATLTFPQTILLRYGQQEPEKGLQQAGEDYGKWYIARLRMLDGTLEDGREFLCAGRFTLADICITYALFLGTTLGLDERYKPQTAAYLERMMRRPAFVAAREEERENLASKAYETDPCLQPLGASPKL
jgi:glutathione S-transferase